MEMLIKLAWKYFKTDYLKSVYHPTQLNIENHPESIQGGLNKEILANSR